MTAAPHSDNGPELHITRIFEAPRELVFAAWLDPDQPVKWSGHGEGWNECFDELVVPLATNAGAQHAR